MDFFQGFSHPQRLQLVSYFWLVVKQANLGGWPFSVLVPVQSSLIRIVGSSIFHVGLWDFLGGTPEAIRVLREERGCGVQDGSESAIF